MSTSIPPEHAREFDRLPPGLRELVLAELAEGNAIAESGGPPAPPVGASVRLARAVAPQRRARGEGYTFYDRNSSLWSGEFTDAKRYFFVLEPPKASEPAPDMSAIRERRNRTTSPIVPSTVRPEQCEEIPERAALRERHRRGVMVSRFLDSRNLDYNQWKEGEGYDLEALDQASPDERRDLEAILVSTAPTDWRDIEALARLGSRAAQGALRRAADNDHVEVRLAVLRFAPNVLTAAQRTNLLANALDTVEIYGGLTAALLLVQDHHPKPVIDALWRGVQQRPGDVAAHFAGMLLYLGGKASAPFDWDHRPFLLRFNTPSPAERTAATRDLCERLGEDPAKRMLLAETT